MSHISSDSLDLITFSLSLQDAGRLLYLGQDDWAHMNCCLWSAEVYEDNSALLQVHSAVSRGRHLVRHYQEMNSLSLFKCLVTILLLVTPGLNV